MISIVSLVAAPVLAGCAEDAGPGAGDDDVAAVSTTCGNNVFEGLEPAAGASSPSVEELGLPVETLLLLHQDTIQETLDTLRIGSILPLTGTLSNFGPDMKNGVELAIADLEAAATVGEPGEAEVADNIDIEYISADSKTDKAEAPTAMNNLVAQDVSGVVGAASSGVTASILGIAVENEILLVTPASTSPALTDPEENENEGFFYRVPPSDALQGQVLGKLVADDGCQTATIVAVNNPYGQGLARNFAEKFEALGGQVEETIFFAEAAATFGSEIEQAEQAQSDAIVFIGYPGEGVPFVQQAFERGLMSTSTFFFSEGVKDPAFVEAIGPEILEGLGGTTPGSTGSAGEWTQRFEEAYGHEPGLFAAESYDATVALGLAAIAAGSTDPVLMKEKMREVWNAPGVKVDDVQTAVAALAAGQDIDWAGPSGDSDWDEFGDPLAGTYAYWFVEEGELVERGRFRVVGEEIEEQ